MVRELLAAAVTAVLPLTASPSAPPAPPPAAGTAPDPAGGWGWPLDPEPAVVTAFHAPPTPWGAGHRGVDLAAAVGQPVLSAGGGRVTFAGRVAGRGVLVVTHAGGVRTSYEPVQGQVAVGTVVPRGGRVAAVSAEPGHCAVTCLHWGVRRGSTYVDPLSLLGAGPPVLLPLW